MTLYYYCAMKRLESIRLSAKTVAVQKGPELLLYAYSRLLAKQPSGHAVRYIRHSPHLEKMRKERKEKSFDLA
jgi:hypothetical protein